MSPPAGSEIGAAIAQTEEALTEARQREDHKAVAEALRRLSEARLAQRAPEKALREAKEAVELFQGLGDDLGAEADAQLCVCNAHLGRIAMQADGCKFPAKADVMGALRASKAALAAYTDLADENGKARASRALSRALLASGVPASMAPRPEALIETKDLTGLIEDLGGVVSPFWEPALEVRNAMSRKSGGPTTSASPPFDQANFRWRDATEKYSYTMTWEKYKGGIPDDSGKKKFNACAFAQGARSAALPLYHSLKPKDPAEMASNASPLCVHILAYDASTNYGAALIAAMQTIKSMIAANLRRLVFVLVGEGAPVAAGSPNALAAGQVQLSPCILAMLRSARIEAPQLSIGFVSGDAASWMSDRKALVQAIFDTADHTNGDDKETELCWSRGEPWMPTLISKPLPEPKFKKRTAPHETV